MTASQAVPSEWETVTIDGGGTLSADTAKRTDWVELHRDGPERVAVDPFTGRIMLTIEGVGLSMSVNQWLLRAFGGGQ